MKNKILALSSLVLAGSILFVAACKKIEDADSSVVSTSIPFVVEQDINDAYVYGQGATSIYTDIPDVVAIAVDSVVGFEGGYGGKTGMDTIKILKSDIVSWPDTVGLGGKSITFEKFNKANYKVTITSNIVIAGAIANPGPTALEGIYERPANGVLIEIKKVFDGVYVIDNPGGGAVPAFPYLLYNYRSSSGGDSLAFPIQPNPCGGGLQLVGPAAPLGISSAEYTSTYPPMIIATAPLTLSWKVLEFSSANASTLNPGAALCQWGTGARTFEKQ